MRVATVRSGCPSRVIIQVTNIECCNSYFSAILEFAPPSVPRGRKLLVLHQAVAWSIFVENNTLYFFLREMFYKYFYCWYVMCYYRDRESLFWGALGSLSFVGKWKMHKRCILHYMELDSSHHINVLWRLYQVLVCKDALKEKNINAFINLLQGKFIVR